MSETGVSEIYCRGGGNEGSGNLPDADWSVSANHVLARQCCCLVRCRTASREIVEVRPLREEK